MSEKELILLQKQKEKLLEKHFNLEGWKSQTIIFLQRIFGKDDPVIKMINDLKYDYSSWNLRDVSGDKQFKDPVKAQAAAIIDAAILEIETLGSPTQQTTGDKLWGALEELLTGKQLKELKELVTGNDNLKEIKEKINILGKEDLVNIISLLISKSNES